MRRYDEAVVVRPEPDGAPGQFLWRGRLHVVREVLACWQERTAWWTGEAARAARGEVDGPGARDAADAKNDRAGALVGARGAVRSGGPSVAGPSTAAAPDEVAQRWDATDRWLWRVVAGAGASSGGGTFELSREGPATTATWRVVRVWD